MVLLLSVWLGCASVGKDFNSEKVKDIENNISINDQEFKNNLNQSFVNYDLFNTKTSFFDIYPYSANSSEKNKLLNNFSAASSVGGSPGRITR